MDEALDGDPLTRLTFFVPVELETVELREELAKNWPALPIRFQSLHQDRWESANGPFGDRIAAQLRVRCGAKDCPGDFGRISLTVSPEPINGASEHLVFEPTRGLLQRQDGVWAEGKRAQACRRSGRSPLGRPASTLRWDWQASRALTPYEVPADSVGLSRRGGTTEIECPICHRIVRFLSQEADAALVELRSRS